MNHNYTQDLKYLLKLADYKPIYIGIIGSVGRREELLNDVLNYNEDFSEALLSSIYSPAGLNIGAITPEEIQTRPLRYLKNYIQPYPRSRTNSNPITLAHPAWRFAHAEPFFNQRVQPRLIQKGMDRRCGSPKTRQFHLPHL